MKATPVGQKEVTLNKNTRLPRNRYILRIVEEVFGISKSSGNPMFTLTPEIVAPETVINPVDGSTINVAGVRLQPFYWSLADKNDPKKSQAIFDRYAEGRRRCGKPLGDDEDIDVNNPPKSVEGCLVNAICGSEEQQQRQEQTPEQKSKNEPGSPIIGDDGKPLVYFKHSMQELLGPADASAAGGGNRPY